MINQIDILQGTFGCPGSNHAGVDPYPEAENWNEAARGDGQSYSGVIETLHREDDETEEFLKRAEKRARQIDRELECTFCK